MEPPNSSKLVRDFMRLREAGDGWRFEVAIIEWPTPGEPVVAWRQFRRWKTKPAESQLRAAEQAALCLERFFRTCGSCGQRHNRGHMHNARMCQTCAEKHHAVVF